MELDRETAQTRIWASHRKRTSQTVGQLTTYSSTAKAYLPLWKLDEVRIVGFAARLLARCSITLLMQAYFGRWRPYGIAFKRCHLY